MVTLTRRTVLLLVAAGVVLVVAVGAALWTSWPGRVRVVQTGCPGVVTGTNNALADYAFTLRWGQVTYGAVDFDSDVKLGPPVGRVTCNIGEIEQRGGGLMAEPGPWPDGTSTGLPRGTTLHAVAGARPTCRLAARFDGRAVVFVAWREPEGTPNPAC